jgi:iron(III) transport system substrate-binding protein
MPNSKKRSLLLLATLALAAVALIAAGCGDDDEGDGGSGAGSLTIYSGRAADLIDPVLDDFSAATGIEIETRFGDTAELAVTLTEEGDASPADLFIAQDAGALGAVDAAGLFAKLPKRTLEQVEARFRAADGGWVGLSGRARVIAYGEDVKAAEVPDSVFDLTESEWKGRVGWAPTNGSFQAFVTAMRAEFGDQRTLEWIEAMVANDTGEYESNTPIRDAIAAGEIDLGLINHYYVAQAKAEEGEDYPVDVAFPTGDLGAMINVAGAGVLGSSDQRETAIELIDFLLARDAQSFFAESSKEYPLVAGVEADPSVPPLAEIPAPEVDLASISDLNGTLELLREGGAL